MKQIIFFTLSLFSALLSFGQCDREVMITSSKTEYLDASGVVQRSEDEQSTIEINRSQVVIIPGNSGRKMTGTIKSIICDWSTPFQEGKTVIQTEFEGPSGTPLHATLTIEGKAGTTTFLMEMVEMPDKKIRVNVTGFKENKKG